ncbi:MAG: hypothetical protein K2N78_04790 [Oscillospiraceae bacterium]|nr:hypothetical protein [Oscillospiraceae bacterium]
MKELENLSAFQARTGAFIYDSLPHDRALETNAGLPLKVGRGGKMEPFMGNTVVFPLPEQTKQGIARIQKRLYQACAPALAEPLEVSSFHITLHDLLNGKPSRELEERMGRLRNAALERVRRIAERRETIRLQSTALFNMVNTSMVLGFAPADEESCERLMTYYEMMQGIVRLDYPLTPHVTVAYFRPGTISVEAVEKLREAVDEAGRWERLQVALPAAILEYQVFSDMNHYWRDM